MIKREQKGKLNILRIVDGISESSAPYNQFSLPFSNVHDITLCTYFKSTIRVPKSMTLFDGDNTFWGFTRAFKSALQNKTYDIVHVHNPHLVVMLILLSPFTDISFGSSIYTVHSSYKLYKLRNKMFLIPAIAIPKRIVFCSCSSFESFPFFFKAFSRDRFRVIQNGVDLNRIDRIIDNRKSTTLKKIFNLLSIGRLVKIKNPFTALKAFYQVKNKIALTFIGDGDLKEPLELEIKNLNLQESVFTPGLLPRDDVYNYLINADLFLSPSRGEGLPVAVLEAMACRCPVILSDIPPHREIAEGTNFIPLIKPDDIEGFTREINRLYEMPMNDRKAIGEKCRELVENKFSLKSMHQKYYDIYKNLAADRYN